MIWITLIVLSSVVMVLCWRKSWVKPNAYRLSHAQTAFNLCFIPMGISLLILFLGYGAHGVDLGTLRKGGLQILVQETRINNLKKDITLLTREEAKNIPNALLNNDNPVGAIVKQLAKAEEDLAKISSWKNEAEINIATRKAGPNAIIVWIFGEQ